MLLSIVMMIKNEEKYLDKTLNALMPLMKDINSELIILDTGSTDLSVEIAKKYTNKVFFAKWNDNFAHMRNISISYAKGDWILILDADEELINYEKLKKFFHSDLHKKYNSASIELKNILSEDEKGYSIAPILRLFKRYDDFRYEGAIHEQPIYKMPIYNSIATFKHYGYLFVNEEIKQLKDKRNKSILLKEIKNQPYSPYINYQLGKSYNISSNYEDAIFYMEKGYDLYSKKGHIPIFVTLDLINLYMELQYFNKCEKLCLKYIKNDNKNIDIYYYLSTSQKCLGKYKQSIENYKRYMYLLDNYDISTQANDMECNGDTVAYRDDSEVNILDNYYKLEMYNEVVKRIDSINDDAIKKAYSVIFMSLYKENKLERVVELYNRFSKSMVEKNKLKENLELVLKWVKEDDKHKMHKILSDIKGNYGILNRIRIDGYTDKETAVNILKNENEAYFADILYYMIKNNYKLEELIIDLNYAKTQRFIDYILINRRDLILDLYDYLYNMPLTLDIKKLKLYSCLARGLLLYGGLKGEKYENLFLIFINYRYEYIKSMYNQDFSDEDILDYIKDDEDRFILDINLIHRNSHGLEYIKRMKKLLLQNKNYVDAIKILINKFEESLNEKDEMKDLKKQYKNIIENTINNGQLDQALKLIDEYKTISKEDVDIKNMQGIIHILQNEYSEAEAILKEAFLMNGSDVNTIFNIAYLKEVKLENDEAILYYKKIIGISNDEQLVIEATNKIKELEKLTYSEVL